MNRMLLIIVMMCTCATTYARELFVKEKKVNRHYTVSASDKLSIENCYGKVRVNTWDRNEITVDVQVTVKSKDEDKAEDIIRDINIDESRSGNSISFITNVKGRTFVFNEYLSMDIDYVINMPRRNALGVTNKFGPVAIDNFDGSLDIALSYGSLTTGKLTGSHNKIRVKFGDKAEIESIERGEIDISYTKLYIQRANSIDVDNMFGKTNITAVQFLSITQKYGDLIIGNVGSLTGTVEFASIKIGEISKRVEMATKYSSKADFGSIGSGVDQVKVNGSFSNLYFDIMAGAGFNADIRTSFGAFHGQSSDLELDKEETDRYTHSEHYTGRIGRGGGKMQINSSYGDVVFR